jgi:hypothetical protein
VGNISRAVVIDNNDNVYVAGQFTTAGGDPANRIAMWNGNSWSALGEGLNGFCYSLALDNEGNVYVGGGFTEAGGVVANKIAKWDGANWSALGLGLNDDCRAIVIDEDGNLFAGGNFTEAGVNLVNSIAQWDGASWQALNSGLNANCQALVSDGAENVYVGGAFWMAGGAEASRIVQWNGMLSRDIRPNRIDEKFNIRTYPNPTTGTVEFYGVEMKNLTEVQIINSAGKVVGQRLLHDGKLDLSDFPSGIYFISFTVGNQIFGAEVVKN